MKITIKVTAEELFAGNRSADAELSVTFDLQRAEKATRDYPGYPATVELIDWKVDEITIYDELGEPIENPLSWGEFVPAIEEWVCDQEEFLGELACEYATDAEEAAREAYWESRSEY